MYKARVTKKGFDCSCGTSRVTWTGPGAITAAYSHSLDCPTVVVDTRQCLKICTRGVGITNAGDWHDQECPNYKETANG